MSSKLSKIKWALISAAALTLIGTVTVAAENKLDGNFPVAGQYVLGDANCDGELNINDVTAIQRCTAEYQTFNELQIKAADTNQDGKVSIDDATLIQSYFAEFDVPFPIGQII